MLTTEPCTGPQNPAKFDSYPKGGGEVCWFSSESVDRSGMLLKNSSICSDNKLLGTIPESLGVVWRGLCFTCFKSVNKSLLLYATWWKIAPAPLPSHLSWSHRPHHIPPSGSAGSSLVSPPTEAVPCSWLPLPLLPCTFPSSQLQLLCTAEAHLTLSFACFCG